MWAPCVGKSNTFSENLKFSGERKFQNGRGFIRDDGVFEETFDYRNISRHFAMCSSDLAGRDDRSRDRLVVAAEMDRIGLPWPPEQVQIYMDRRAAWLRRSAALARFHGSVGFLGLPRALEQFQRKRHEIGCRFSGRCWWRSRWWC